MAQFRFPVERCLSAAVRFQRQMRRDRLRNIRAAWNEVLRGWVLLGGRRLDRLLRTMVRRPGNGWMNECVVRVHNDMFSGIYLRKYRKRIVILCNGWMHSLDLAENLRIVMGNLGDLLFVCRIEIADADQLG